MKKFILFFLLTIFTFTNLFSQVNKDGLPIITQYTDKDYGDAGQIWAIEQDTRGIMYFGCNYGLKTYNGKEWKSYDNPRSTIIRSLASGNDGIIYYGAESDFGMLMPDETGELTFHSIYLDKNKGDSILFTSVWKTIISENKVFFQSFNSLYYCDLPILLDEDGKMKNELHIIDPSVLFHLSFTVNNEFYIREWENGLCRVVDNKLELIPGGEKFALLKIYTMLPYDDNRILIGTREEGFFLYDKTNKKQPIKPFQIGDNNEIVNSVLYSGEQLQNGNYAVGTLANGIFIFDKKGTVINHYNNETGLPQPSILSMYYNDNIPNAQLWFVCPDFGVFRADVSGTFCSWDKHTGIEGIVNDVIRFNGRLYLAADNSVYTLKKDGSVGFKRLYSEQQNIWKFYKFKVKDSNEQKLLMASFSGVYEIKDSLVIKITDANNVQSLYQSKRDPNILYIGSETGFGYIKYENEKWSPLINKEKFTHTIISIFENEDFIAVGSTGSGLFKFKDFKTDPLLIDSARGLPLLGRDVSLTEFNKKFIVFNGAGVYEKTDADSIIPFEVFGKQFSNKTTGISKFVENNNDYWMAVFNSTGKNPDHHLVRFLGKKELVQDSVFAKIIPQKSTFCLYPDNEYVWISNEKGLYKFNNNINNNYNIQYSSLITKVSTFDSLLFAGNYIEKSDSGLRIINSQNENLIPVLNYKHNMLAFNWTAPYFVKESETKYSYRLVGHSENWSKWNVKNDTRYTNLAEGDYTFEVKAKNIYNIESTIAKYSFSILPPWYRTIWAYILFTIAGIFAILLIIKLYTKKLKRENEKLEQTVKERTTEIRQQNEEITAQRDEIHAQKEEVEKAKDKIEKQKESIMDSIHYASRIQEAVLPPDNFLKEVLGEHFVLFRPRDIVSGDFYWSTKKGNKTVIVAADSTGHGVPGAFMSMLGMSFLNEIVNKDDELQANKILNKLRDSVKRSLRQTGKDNEAKDGMDLALCIIDTEEMKLQFAGAYNPLYLLRNNEIIRVKADRMPIGIYLREKESFTNNIIDIQKGDLLYIFSDGYVDQFGGLKDSKIKSAKFKEILIENSQKSMEEQKAALANFLEGWMDNYDKKGKKYSQIDDILVIGIEI